jgi:hypothetical protein
MASTNAAESTPYKKKTMQKVTFHVMENQWDTGAGTTGGTC